MDKEEFKKLVEAGINAIPKKFLKKLDNVAIVIEDNPTPAQKKELNLSHSFSLFGLYEGVPQIRRGAGYSGVLPDKITIFQKPIQNYARNNEEIKEMVKNTVWHEIAHHFGMTEKQIRVKERKKRVDVD